MEIVPAILAKTREELEQAIRKIELHTERVHLDILDGGFTPDKTILGYVELEQIKTNLKIDVHLMVMHPEEYIPASCASWTNGNILCQNSTNG